MKESGKPGKENDSARQESEEPGEERREPRTERGSPGKVNGLESGFVHGSDARTPNDPKLSDGGGLARPLPTATHEEKGTK